MANLPTFLELVEIHERRWGTAQYPGRPTLTDLMDCPIVALWFINNRFIFSVHQDRSALNVFADKILTGKVTDNRKLAQVFIDRKPVKFTVTIICGVQSEKEHDPLEMTQKLKHQPIIRTPVADRLRPGRNITWLPGRNEIRAIEIIKKAPIRRLYECPRCHATQDSVVIVGDPRCPACGAVMQIRA